MVNQNALIAKNKFLEKFTQVVIVILLALLLQGLSFYGNRVFFNSTLVSIKEIENNISSIQTKQNAVQRNLTQKTYENEAQKKKMVDRISNFDENIKKMRNNIELANDEWYTKAYISNLIYALLCTIIAYFLVYPLLRYGLYISAFFSYNTSIVYGLSFLGNLGMFLTILISLVIIFAGVILISKRHLKVKSDEKEG